jgi:F-type H+-transporting ATPase subunit delta
MATDAAVKRYARGLVDYLAGSADVEKGVGDLARAKEILAAHGELIDMLSNMLVSDGDKFEVIDRIFADGVSVGVRNFLKLLVKRRKVGLAVEIIDAAQRICFSEKEVEVLLRTSKDLDAEFAKGVRDKLKKRLRKDVRLRLEVDPGLIGGAQMLVGQLLIDGSVRHGLDELRDKLLAI